MSVSKINLYLKRATVGSIAFLLLALLESPDEFFEFIITNICGIIVTMAVFIPLDRMIIQKQLKKFEITTFFIGVLAFEAMYIFVIKDLMEMIIYILGWIVMYDLISIFVSQFVKELEESLP